MNEPRKLLTFEFIGLCLVSCLACCNISVFYSLFHYLETLGFPAELRGVVVGVYSLTAMVLYLVASPLLNAGNALRYMMLGIVAIAVSGFGYFFVHTFWGLLALRSLNGAGQFCMSAGAMALFVTVIPLEKSGQAFGLYSVAILVAYGWVPAVMDALTPFFPTQPHGYAAATVSLVPAAWIVWQIRRRRRKQPEAELPVAPRTSWADSRANVTQLPVILLILLNMSYFANWSSLFFLFKGFAQLKGIANVGTFFMVQTGLMIAIRLLAGRLFDSVDKALLTGGSFVIVALGHLALGHLPGVWAVPLVGCIFGVGMGTGYPAINGLMFQVSPPRLRSQNANLMLFAVQAGFFLGPVIGGALVAHRGYRGYFNVSIGLSLAAAAVSAVLSRHCHRQAT